MYWLAMGRNFARMDISKTTSKKKDRECNGGKCENKAAVEGKEKARNTEIEDKKPNV